MTTATTEHANVLHGREIEIETPEHVAIGYELAGPGSRFAALLIDILILASVLLVLWIGVPLVALATGVPGQLMIWGAASLILLSFAVLWGYFAYFEGFRDGQTPGKKRLRLRTVHDGGYPLTFRGAATRALLHIIDIQPVGSFAVGGLCVLLHPQSKRLGDMAAGTIVVRERTAGLLPEEAEVAAKDAGPPRLAEPEFQLLARYIGRRDELDAAVRSRIGGKLAGRFAERVRWDASRETADAYLLRLHAAELARRRTAGAGGAAGSAKATALVRRQRPRWNEYEALLQRAQRRGLNRLSETEVTRFAALYREVAADLARARTYGGSRALVYTLERLVGAGHNLLYRPGRRGWRRLWRWLTGGFPSLVRRRWRPVALSAVCFFLPALIVYALVLADPSLARELLPPQMMARAEEGRALQAAGRGYVDIPEPFMPVMATSLIANNVQVTFFAFAGGILAGLGTVWILLVNGIMLGSVAGLFASYGLNLHLWSFVLPHGVIELTAIVIAGGAGLWLGSALVLPGRRTRRDALVERGREAVSLLAGTALMLVLAGIIEGFVSPSDLPRPAKLAFAGVFALSLGLYLLRAVGTEPDGDAR